MCGCTAERGGSSCSTTDATQVARSTTCRPPLLLSLGDDRDRKVCFYNYVAWYSRHVQTDDPTPTAPAVDPSHRVVRAVRRLALAAFVWFALLWILSMLGAAPAAAEPTGPLVGGTVDASSRSTSSPTPPTPPHLLDQVRPVVDTVLEVPRQVVSAVAPSLEPIVEPVVDGRAPVDPMPGAGKEPTSPPAGSYGPGARLGADGDVGAPTIAPAVAIDVRAPSFPSRSFPWSRPLPLPPVGPIASSSTSSTVSTSAGGPDRHGPLAVLGGARRSVHPSVTRTWCDEVELASLPRPRPPVAPD